MIKELHNIDIIKDMDKIKVNDKSFFGNFKMIQDDNLSQKRLNSNKALTG